MRGIISYRVVGKSSHFTGAESTSLRCTLVEIGPSFLMKSVKLERQNDSKGKTMLEGGRRREPTKREKKEFFYRQNEQN